MQEAHTRQQLLKFNVHWIVEWFDETVEVRVTCKNRGKKIGTRQLARHSSECATCSVLKSMMSAIRKACDNFDDWNKKEECLKGVRVAAEILDGLERLTKHRNWATVH